jgi:hypothetical protein
MRGPIILLFTQHYQVNNEMSGAYSMHGRNLHEILVEDLKGRDQLGNQSVNGRKVLTEILKKCRLRIGFNWLRRGTNGGIL